jgi:hypothetical protein
VLSVRVPLEAANPAAAEESVTAALSEWNLRPALARLWVRSAVGYLPIPLAELVLEYDEAVGLVSCEAWADGRRVYGIDDWVGTV